MLSSSYNIEMKKVNHDDRGSKYISIFSMFIRKTKLDIHVIFRYKVFS